MFRQQIYVASSVERKEQETQLMKQGIGETPASTGHFDGYFSINPVINWSTKLENSISSYMSSSPFRFTVFGWSWVTNHLFSSTHHSNPTIILHWSTRTVFSLAVRTSNDVADQPHCKAKNGYRHIKILTNRTLIVEHQIDWKIENTKLLKT